ncbi:MAG: hypothetical protein ABI333_10320 [bacterium]
MIGRVLQRVALGVFLLGGLVLIAPSASAQTAPSVAEIRTKTTRYLRIFEAKGIRFEIYYAKKILNYLQTNPKAAQGLYMSVKPRWDRKLGPHLGVEALDSVAAVAKAKAAKQIKVLEVTCMKARSIATADAACIAAADVYSAAGNNAKLKAICQGQGHRSPYKDWRKRNYACQLLSAAGSSVGMNAINAASCAELPTVFDTHKRSITSGMNKQANSKNFLTVGFKFVKCKNWDYVIEKLIHWGGRSGDGAALLKALHTAGKKLEKRMLAYMKKHQRNLFNFEHAGYALDHYTSWMHDNRLHRSCRKYIPYAKKLADKVWGNFAWYFRMSKCKAAANIVAKRLSSPLWRTRKGACVTLGQIGNKRHLRKVKILARSDSYTTFVRHYRVYPVRNACRAAAGQIQLR